jgi:hypothetical protein
MYDGTSTVTSGGATSRNTASTAGRDAGAWRRKRWSWPRRVRWYTALPYSNDTTISRNTAWAAALVASRACTRAARMPTMSCSAKHAATHVTRNDTAVIHDSRALARRYHDGFRVSMEHDAIDRDGYGMDKEPSIGRDARRGEWQTVDVRLCIERRTRLIPSAYALMATAANGTFQVTKASRLLDLGEPRRVSYLRARIAS